VWLGRPSGVAHHLAHRSGACATQKHYSVDEKKVRRYHATIVGVLGGTLVIAIDSFLAAWLGRFMCGVFFCTGVGHVWPPPLPSAWEELHALFLFLVALLPLATGEIVACYLDLISTTTKIKDRRERLQELQRLQDAVFAAVTAAANSALNIFKSIGRGPRGQE
jgi:hypothetical protein